MRLTAHVRTSSTLHRLWQDHRRLTPTLHGARFAFKAGRYVADEVPDDSVEWLQRHPAIVVEISALLAPAIAAPLAPPALAVPLAPPAPAARLDDESLTVEDLLGESTSAPAASMLDRSVAQRQAGRQSRRR